ncbi:unnamed protein product [Symbiodinium sp. CCMP2592]|nr:unnamed protein product [Symbiodinium sp. CCMP2592]
MAKASVMELQVEAGMCQVQRDEGMQAWRLMASVLQGMLSALAHLVTGWSPETVAMVLLATPFVVATVYWMVRAQHRLATMEQTLGQCSEMVHSMLEKLSDPTGEHDDLGSGLLRHYMMEEFIAGVRTMQHFLGLLAFHDRQLAEFLSQLEETLQGYVELAKAVNNLLSELSVRMPKTATATSILDVVKNVREILLKVQADLEDGAGKVAAGTTAAAATPTPGDGSNSVLDRCRETLARVELLDKNLEKMHNKFTGLAKLFESYDPTKTVVEVGSKTKMQSIQDDVGLNRGQANQLHKDKVTLLKTMEKSLATLQNHRRWAAPIDSAGQNRAIDLLLAHGETQKEHSDLLERTDQVLQELREACRDQSTKTQELGNIVFEFELRERFAERFGIRGGVPITPIQTASSRAPTVIDLQSRIARPVNFATVTFPDGRVSMVPEGQLH